MLDLRLYWEDHQVSSVLVRFVINAENGPGSHTVAWLSLSVCMHIKIESGDVMTVSEGLWYLPKISTKSHSPEFHLSDLRN